MERKIPQGKTLNITLVSPEQEHNAPQFAVVFAEVRDSERGLQIGSKTFDPLEENREVSIQGEWPEWAEYALNVTQQQLATVR